MRQTSAGKIRIVIATVTDRQHELVAGSLERANASAQASGESVPFEFTTVGSRGFAILEAAADADVVILGLEDEVLPGEASHLVAAFPEVRLIGVDHEARARVVLGAVDEPISSDLPTVVRWIARNEGRQEPPPVKRSAR